MYRSLLARLKKRPLIQDVDASDTTPESSHSEGREKRTPVKDEVKIVAECVGKSLSFRGDGSRSAKKLKKQALEEKANELGPTQNPKCLSAETVITKEPKTTTTPSSAVKEMTEQASMKKRLNRVARKPSREPPQTPATVATNAMFDGFVTAKARPRFTIHISKSAKELEEMAPKKTSATVHSPKTNQIVEDIELPPSQNLPLPVNMEQAVGPVGPVSKPYAELQCIPFQTNAQSSTSLSVLPEQEAGALVPMPAFDSSVPPPLPVQQHCFPPPPLFELPPPVPASPVNSIDPRFPQAFHLPPISAFQQHYSPTFQKPLSAPLPVPPPPQHHFDPRAEQTMPLPSQTSSQQQYLVPHHHPLPSGNNQPLTPPGNYGSYKAAELPPCQAKPGREENNSAQLTNPLLCQNTAIRDSSTALQYYQVPAEQLPVHENFLQRLNQQPCQIISDSSCQNEQVLPPPPLMQQQLQQYPYNYRPTGKHGIPASLSSNSQYFINPFFLKADAHNSSMECSSNNPKVAFHLLKPPQPPTFYPTANPQQKAVIPLCNFPLHDQHALKEETTLRILSDLRQQIVLGNRAASTWFDSEEERQGTFLQLERLAFVQPTDGYRKKCDFTVGINPETNALAIGFLLEPDTTLVGPVEDLRHIPDQMKKVVYHLEGQLLLMGFPPFDPTSGGGHWMTAAVRVSAECHIMVVLSFHTQSLDKLQIKRVRNELSAFAENGPLSKIGLRSFYINERQDWNSGNLQLLWGDDCLTERLLDRSFRISPRSYFTCNTAATEVCLNIISDMFRLHPHCTLIDICCGTGTIGLSLSGRCGQVIGLDVLPEAINDARMNAMVNDITNAEFFSGSAEECLATIWRRVLFNDVICVIEPPRNGLTSQAVNLIRKQPNVKKVAILLNDPMAATRMLVDMSRAPSNHFKGDPFIPIKAVPVDSFPHTNNFTIIFLFLRVPMSDLLNPGSIAAHKYNFMEEAKEAEKDDVITSSSFEESFDNAPPPDLSWKPISTKTDKVTGDQTAAASRGYKNYFDLVVQGRTGSKDKPDNVPKDLRESLLSTEQVQWLDQMTEMYEQDFLRQKWVEVFLRQNKENPGRSFREVNPKVWSEYSKQYVAYMNRQPETTSSSCH